MANTRTPKMKRERYNELRRILEERRLSLMGDMRHKIRNVRAEREEATHLGVRDEVESSEADVQGDMEFAVLQMKAETLKKIGEALVLLSKDEFGYCHECGQEITSRRLRALPFAVRCRNCEEARESNEQQSRRVFDKRSDTLSVFSDQNG